MPDQTIDAIKVKLGVDAADIKNQVSAANTAIDALGTHAKRVVNVELNTTLQQGGSEAIKRLEFLKNKGVDVKVGVTFRQSGESSIASMRRSINTGLVKAGSINVPVKIELNEQQARGLMNSVQRAVNAAARNGKSIDIPFTWSASEPPKYTGDPIKVDWTWGDGPSGPPGGGGGGGGGGGPSPAAGPRTGRSRTSSRTSTAGTSSSTPSTEEATAEKTAKETARAERKASEAAGKAAREAERDARQQQADQQQARTTGTATGASGSGSMGRQTRAERSAANKAAHAAARAQKRAEQAAEKAALQAERDALKAAQAATSSPATPAASAAPAAAPTAAASRGGIGHPVGRQGFRKNYIAGGGRPRGISRDRGPLPSSVPRHGFTVGDYRGHLEADAAMAQSGPRTGLRVGEGWDAYVENIVEKSKDFDFRDPDEFTEFLQSLSEDERKKFWRQYRSTGETSKRDPLQRIKDPRVHAQFMAVIERQAKRRAAEVAANPGSVNLTGAAKGQAGVRSGGRQSMAGAGGPRGRTEKKTKLSAKHVLSDPGGTGVEETDLGEEMSVTAAQQIWQDTRVPEATPRIVTTPELLRMTPEQRLEFLRAEDAASGFTPPPSTEPKPKRASRKKRREHLQSATPGTPPPKLSSIGAVAAPEALPDESTYLAPEIIRERAVAAYKARRDIRIEAERDRRLGISRTGLPEGKQYGPPVPAGLLGKVDLAPQKTEQELEAEHAASLMSFRIKRDKTLQGAEEARKDIAGRAISSEERTGVSPRVRIAGLVERGMRAKYGDVSKDMVETAVKATLKSGKPIEEIAKFWGITKYAEGGLLHAADGIYSRKIGHDWGASGQRSAASLKDPDWIKRRAAHLRQPENRFCKHCGMPWAEMQRLRNSKGRKMGPTVDTIQSAAEAASLGLPDPHKEGALQTLCPSCQSSKSGFSHNPDETWDHPRPFGLLSLPGFEKITRADFLSGGRLFGVKTKAEAIKRLSGKERKKFAEGGTLRSRSDLLELWNQKADDPKLTDRDHADWMRGELRNLDFALFDVANQELTGRSLESALSGLALKHGKSRSEIDKLFALYQKSSKTKRLAEGGVVRHGGLLERMAQAGHEPSIRVLTKANSGAIPGVEWAERGDELGISDPNTGETEILPHHKVPQWIQRARDGHGRAKDLTGFADGGLGDFSDDVLQRAGIRRTKNNRYQNISDNRFISTEQATARASAAAGSGITKVFVVNWPNAMTTPGSGPSKTAPTPKAPPKVAATPPTPPPGAPPIMGAPATPGAAASPAAAAAAAAGGGTPSALPKMSRTSYRDIALEARERRLSNRMNLVEMQAQVQSAKSLTPARAFTTSIAQLSEQVSGRGEIQRRAKIAEARISVAGQMDSAYQMERAKELDLHKRRIQLENRRTKAIAAGVTFEAKYQEELDSILKDQLPEQREVRRDAFARKQKWEGKAQAATEDVLRPGDVVKTLLAGFVGLAGGTIAMKAAFTALNAVVDTSGKAIADWAEMQLGFANKSAAFGKALGDAVQQQDGNTKAVVANTLALAGFNEKTAQQLRGGFESRAGAIAGNQAAQGRFEQIMATSQFSKDRPAGLPAGYDTNLVKTVGGPFGLPFGPGSTAPIAEILQNQIGQTIPLPRDFGPQVVGMAGAREQTPERLAELSAKLANGLSLINDQTESAGLALETFAVRADEGSDKVKRTADIFRAIGADQLASETERRGLSITGLDATNDVRARQQAAEFLQAQNTYTPTADELAKTMERPMFAQRMELFRQRELGLGMDIPAATAMQFMAQPQLPYGQAALGNGRPAGIVPSKNLLPGIIDEKDFAAQAKAYSTAYQGEFADKAIKSQTTITDEINKGKNVLREWGVPEQMISDIQTLGTDIQTITRGLEQRNLNLTTAQYTNQIRLAERAWGDAKDMAAAVEGHTKQTVGGLEGQNLALARQSQLLGFMLEQRQINYKLAMAGFTAPGDTPEARQARIEYAKKEAEYAQKQLNIQKQMGSNQYKVANLQIFRSMTDAQAEISLLKEARSIAQETAAKSDQIKAMNDAQALLIQQAQEYAKEGRGAVEIWNKATSEIEGRTGKAFDRWMGKVISGYTAAGEAFGAGIQAALVTPGEGNGGRNDGGNNGPGSGSSTTPNADNDSRHAAGIVGMAKGRTRAIMGEAGDEAVAILRNPQSLPMGNLGGGGGGGTVNVNINISGGGNIDRQMLTEWGAQIQRATLAALDRKTSLLGLRTP